MVFQHPEEKSIVGVDSISTYSKNKQHIHSDYTNLYHGAYLSCFRISLFKSPSLF